MNFLHFKSFIITADHKSITAAAKTLYITPASLLQQINLLEDELGFKVFKRSRRGVTLTRAGKKLYQGCNDLICRSEILFKECKALSEIDESLIRISVARPYHLFKLGKQYMAEHPHVRIEFDRIDPLTQDNIMMHFTKDNFDMIQTGFDPEATEMLPYEIISYPADRFCCVCSPSHLFSYKEAVNLQDLNGLTLHTFSNFSFGLNILEKLIDANKLNIPMHRTLFSERDILKCCANNGIYILEEQAARAFSYLSVIPIEPVIPCYVGLAYMKNAKPAVQHFAQYVRTHMDIIADQYQ